MVESRVERDPGSGPDDPEPPRYLVTAFTIDLISELTAPTAAVAMATRSRLCLRVMAASRRRDPL